MKLSMSMIEGYLSHHDTESDIQDDERSIHGVRFLSGGRQRSSREFVYIGQANDFLKDPEYADALILASGKSHIVCRGSDYEELLNDVLSAFDYYNELDQKLMQTATLARGLDEMVGMIGEVIHAPFLVFSIDGAFLAGLHVDALPSASLRTSIEERASLGAETIGGYFTNKSGTVQHDLTDQAQATYGADGEAAVCRYLAQDDETIGFVMCFPLDERAIGLATSVEDAFASYLAQAREFTDALSPYQSQHRALAELIGGKPVADESLARVVDTVGGSHGFYLACVKSLAIRNRTQRLLLATEIEKSNVACLSCEIGETVAFLVAEDNVSGLVAEIERRFNVRSAAIGMSMPMASIRQASTAWRQALFACESSEEPGVRYCRDLALPFLLRVLKSEPASADLLHPALSTLAAYDAETHSDLLETLKAYAALGCNQTECARKLHVHINTLKYRLKRIEELTGLNFKDENDLFYLRLSIAIGN